MKYIDITARALAESQKNVKLQENNTNGTPFRSHCERSANSMQKLDAANCSPGSSEHVDSILVEYNQIAVRASAQSFMELFAPIFHKFYFYKIIPFLDSTWYMIVIQLLV